MRIAPNAKCQRVLVLALWLVDLVNCQLCGTLVEYGAGEQRDKRSEWQTDMWTRVL